MIFLFRLLKVSVKNTQDGATKPPEKKGKLTEPTELTDKMETFPFWMKVHNTKNLAGGYSFRELSSGVVRMLTLPVSNADVERIFSQVNVVKTFKHSNMKTNLLEAILTCKYGLSRTETRVDDYVIPVKLLHFDSSIYG